MLGTSHPALTPSFKMLQHCKLFENGYDCPRTGTCTFLPSSVRKEMSTRVHSLNSQQPPYPELFDPVQPALRKQLNALHSQFVSSHSFLAFLARNSSDGSSSATPQDEFHLVPIPCLAPTSTMMRDSGKKGKGNKVRAYSCDASTSRDNDDSSRGITVDRERHLFKHSDGSIRHDIPEAREAFANVLTERLEVISRELDRSDANTYARDLPRDLAACSLLPSLHDNRILEETTSDEEVEKYVGRIDGTRRRSESTSPVLFNFRPSKANPYENGFAPPPPAQAPQHHFPDLPTPPVFSKSNRSMDYRFSDSSGFCSSESAYLSERSFGRKKISLDIHSYQIGSNSLPRRLHSMPTQNVFTPLRCRTLAPPLTLVLRENGQPPMVAKIPSEMITLAKFRRTFGVSRTENKRYALLFSTLALLLPYQLQNVL
ncbi:hypothetical protein OESDEN_04273 [Oesophagostomum dentatum]|uniref:Uncharacterized protein n=1 Tax=Oesophagostomum dentatum TaxID=61180 RepID=A0A0B1TET4_OESDE|nr:hypothetical protein OESDEN_04273 [Oesophagostomum dentatum]